ncbi:hypothetical protein ABZ554_40095 [Streptomyces sp. NPDC020125]|uniref:hypothetical protein n=1 Tax=Streptomyces sp. NPDC020125 TaxID=3154593 RepID=UPI0033E411D7
MWRWRWRRCEEGWRRGGEQHGRTRRHPHRDRSRRPGQGQRAADDLNGDGRPELGIPLASGTARSAATARPPAPRRTPIRSAPAARSRIRIPALGGDVLAAADTDGDGTDELAVSLRTGGTEPLTIRPDAPGEIAHRRTLDRTVPARVDGRKVPKKQRAVRLFGAGDFDHDGKDEDVLAWGPDPLFAL